MKHFLRFVCALAFVSVVLTAQAGITTYTFTSAQWASRQGTTVCDGTTDGWQCNQAAAGYSGSYATGVQVTKGYSGAGATSVQTFHKVRRLIVNYATTTSGKGSISVKVGDNAAIDSAVTISTTNRDLTILLPEEQTGTITLTVPCTHNSIYINSISIRSADGLSPDFTQTTYRLVTDAALLQDSDQVIIGLADGSTNKIMGYYNESVSQNNIHAIAGTYSAERDQVSENAEAVYTIRKTTDTDGTPCFILQDELRYEEAYLVANGGKTKNRLAAWDQYTSPSYGSFGLWNITIDQTGAAQIENRGTSLGKYLQYNATDALFACYQNPSQYTPVALYRATEAPATDRPVIQVPLINFGEVCLTTPEPTPSSPATFTKTVQVNALNLSEDMQAALASGEHFSLSAATLDRDGDLLTIRAHISQSGTYTDRLTLRTQDTTVYATVLLRAVAPMSIAEVVEQDDHTSVYLNDVVVTKKYDRYIFVRDDTGSMLIYDTGKSDGSRYGSGLSKGDVLSGVHGKYQNYYGVPELLPNQLNKTAQKVECLPDSGILALDSADVCRYVVLDSVTLQGATCTYRNRTYATADKFNIGTLVEGHPTRIEAIVSYDHDVLTLWLISQTCYPEPTAIDAVSADDTDSPSPRYNLLGAPVGTDYRGIIVQKGHKTLR